MLFYVVMYSVVLCFMFLLYVWCCVLLSCSVLWYHVFERGVPYWIVLCCVVLYCIVLYCVVLYCVASCCFGLNVVVSLWFVLRGLSFHCGGLLRIALCHFEVCYIVLCCVVLCCVLLYRVVLCCIVLC